MDRKSGYYILLGLAIGAALGVFWGAANGNVAMGIGLGAIAGVFIGWFAAAADFRSRNEKKEDKQ